MESFDIPLEFVRKSIGRKVAVRLRNKVQIQGRLSAYDDHLNMMIEDATLSKEGTSQFKNLIYLRGDMIVLVGKS